MGERNGLPRLAIPHFSRTDFRPSALCQANGSFHQLQARRCAEAAGNEIAGRKRRSLDRGEAGRDTKGGRRNQKLGIPSVIDRVVQQALVQKMVSIFEP